MTSTLGVLALAKYRRLIGEVKPIVNKPVESGFWVSKKTLEELIRELSEKLEILTNLATIGGY